MTGEKETVLRRSNRSLRKRGSFNIASLPTAAGWLTVALSRAGRNYVTHFPSGADGGRFRRREAPFPAWRSDSKEIYFIGTDGSFHAASVNTTRGEFELDQVRPLFQISYTAPLGIPYDVAPDGQRFIFATYPESVSTPLVLITNWTAAPHEIGCVERTLLSAAFATRSRSTLLNFPCSLLHSRDHAFS